MNFKLRITQWVVAYLVGGQYHLARNPTKGGERKPRVRKLKEENKLRVKEENP